LKRVPALSELLYPLDTVLREWVTDLLKRLKDGKKLSRMFFKELIFKFCHSLDMADISFLIGESTAIIKVWTSQGAPRNDDGTYSLVRFIQWYKAWQHKGSQNLTTSRSRKIGAEASLAELELAEQVGRLVDRDLVDRAQGEHITTCRNMLQGVPHRLALIVPDADRARFIKEAESEIEFILKNLGGGNDKQNPA